MHRTSQCTAEGEYRLAHLIDAYVDLAVPSTPVPADEISVPLNCGGAPDVAEDAGRPLPDAESAVDGGAPATPGNTPSTKQLANCIDDAVTALEPSLLSPGDDAAALQSAIFDEQVSTQDVCTALAGASKADAGGAALVADSCDVSAAEMLLMSLSGQTVSGSNDDFPSSDDGGAGSCASVGAACTSTTDCCAADGVTCDHIGGLIATSCCVMANKPCTTTNDCCGQLQCKPANVSGPNGGINSTNTCQ
jgi:hypothetical protein